jgi:hypothetical protein
MQLAKLADSTAALSLLGHPDQLSRIMHGQHHKDISVTGPAKDIDKLQ